VRQAPHWDFGGALNARMDWRFRFLGHGFPARQTCRIPDAVRHFTRTTMVCALRSLGRSGSIKQRLCRAQAPAYCFIPLGEVLAWHPLWLAPGIPHLSRVRILMAARSLQGGWFPLPGAATAGCGCSYLAR